MKIALVVNGTVVNTITCESIELAEELNTGVMAVDIDGLSAGIGWSYDGQEFTAPVIVKTPEEIASENMATARSEYDRATDIITALNEQIEDADYDGTTEENVKAELAEWTDYRKQLRAYIKAGDGSQELPPPPNIK
ncbi:MULTISPECIES: hypothetical protein [Serratia]|uniref:hypothetical protein n=1 Tax=Serratia TaxID=613 RepID=UPI0011B97A73|nr:MULTISPECIES: hypothetical protein [Serratia]MDP8717047.1 hypothetical protein [Serratia marcescens]TWY29792.1 hypothetical protein FR992_25310 [Serratia marcescens]TYR78247.1 hypothetical protein FYK38_24930 [Serratia marcescens]